LGDDDRAPYEVSRLRLNQALAKTGHCSRRQADALIAARRVRVNGRVADDFSLSVDPLRDRIEVDGKTLTFKAFVYVAMYKPRGVVTTCSDEEGRESVLDLLPGKLRHLRPVGRLDMNSEGLLIFTNDGDLTQRLTHPSHHLPKTYVVTVKGAMSDLDLKALAAGVVLDDGPTQPGTTRLLERSKSATIFELTISEGRNRQVRRMCEHVGYRVSRLVREAVGGLQLGQMTPGSWRYLTAAEVRALESGGNG